MRVDGSSRSSKAQSSESSGDVQKSRGSERNEVREEQAPHSTGHDESSHYEEEDSSSPAPKLQPPPPPPPPEPPPEEPRPVPKKDLKRGDTGEDVARLQESLVELGYMTKEQVATGPGTFGPQTEAALQKFQQEHGVTANGRYETGTREALSQALTHSARAGGGTRGSAMSAEEAFITQFTSEYNPNGPRGSTNCGPASLAMSLAYTGHMPPGLTKEQQVDHARALMSPRRASEFTYVTASDGSRVPMLNRDHELTGGTMVADGIKGAGLTSRYGQGWEALDKQLAAGNPVIANGATHAAWRSQFPERMGSGDIGHLNAILGKTADGKYLVADPLHTGGPVAMTRQQLSVFFSPTGGQPSFNALEGASRGAGTGGSGAAASTPQLPAPVSTQTRAVSGTQGAAGTDVVAKAQADAQALATTLQTSLPGAAKQFEELIRNNPDPAYQEALVKAAEPSLAKMGELFGGLSPEAQRELNPPPPAKKPDLSDPEVLKRLGGPETTRKHETYRSLAAAAELMKDPAAGMVGSAFASKMPPGITQGPLLTAVAHAIDSGLGSRLAFDIESTLARPQMGPPGSTHTYAADLPRLHETLWRSVDKIRADFSVAAQKAEAHQKKLTELLSEPSRMLTEEQKQAAIDAFMNADENGDGKPDRAGDMAEFERLSQLLSKAAPDGVPANAQDPRAVALARELPRMAESESGAEYLARQLEAKGEGRPVFFDVASQLKDGKDFNEKLAVALVKAAGREAIKAASVRDVDTAKDIYEGLARYSHLFGMKPDDMRAFTSVLQTLKPNMPPEQYRRNMEPLKKLLTDQEAGLLGRPDSIGGQALRGLGVTIAAAAFIGDAGEWSQADVAARMKIVGDGLSVGADGAAYLTDMLVKGSSAAKALGKLSAVGAVVGAVGDAMQGFQAVQEGKYFSAAASGAQAVGGAILAASAFTSVTPGLQLLGAGLFVGGLIVKFLDPDRLVLRGQQVDLLEKSGLDRQTAEGIVYFGSEYLQETLGKGAGMSVENIQRFVGSHPEIAGNKGAVNTLAKAAEAYGMTGPNFEEFVERLSRSHNGGEDLSLMADQLNILFFNHPGNVDANGRYITPEQQFRDWVKAGHPEVDAWAQEMQRQARGD
ncbi:peptidoglycan-binding protein [Myxococcus sp. RHSTA-1-4]|uniref:peptidoglycan-binding protein n=1 Tax=Myxococcus sp. RHSTA-1-4 TaxID=2874601 RepID=UPI001CBEF1E5|nr:peptidoglycan-binding protein [Myxococcus sp. RHSTA-1-4]MBZ4416201.1 peptidoglycan-binding protein [Myxococcus sp. RHSTA-1-4]